MTLQGFFSAVHMVKHFRKWFEGRRPGDGGEMLSESRRKGAELEAEEVLPVSS